MGKTFKKKRNSYLLVCIVALISSGHTGISPALSLSTSDESGSEAVLYDIKYSRIQRLVAAEIHDAEGGLGQSRELLDLIKEAKSLAEKGDYEIAIELLDLVISLIEEPAGKDETLTFPEETPAKPIWTIQGLCGSELWQQKFGISIAELDTLIYESQTNPYMGLRIGMERSDIISRTRIEVEGKFSREYVTALCALDHNRHVTGFLHTFMDNNFEATSYRQQQDLSYFDERLNLGANFIFSKNWSLEVKNEIQLRHYTEESEFFANFFQNQLSPKITADWSGMGMAQVGYHYRDRDYALDFRKNYKEHIFTADFWSKQGAVLSLQAIVQARQRSYTHGFVDTLFTADFNEWYGRLYTSLKAHRNLDICFEGELDKKNYATYAQTIPDYVDLFVEPALALHSELTWRLKLGYRYRIRSHRFSQAETDSPEIEDFNAVGPSLSLDLFLANGLIASLSNTFEVRRYPNNPISDGGGFSIYSNRDINSFFLFLTWNISPRWEVVAMGHFDREKERDMGGGDSRSNLFNFELLYNF